MANWYNALWQHRQAVTIDHTVVSGSLTNFVLFVNETGFVKPGTGNDVFDRAKANGGDIIVTTSDGTTKIDRELVKFDTSNKKLEMWIRVPSVSSVTDTTIYIYYGNPVHTEPNTNGTWTSYQYVSHDGGDTDATGNAASSTTYGTPTLVDGLTGEANSFPSPGDIIDTGLAAITYPFTFQTWVKPQSFTGPYVLGNFNTSDEDFTLYTQSSQWVFNAENGGGAHGFGTVNQNSWNFLGISIDSDYSKTYHDGDFIGTVSSNGAIGDINSGTNLKINDKGDTVNTAGGIVVDEIRIFSGVLSDDHIDAEYKNQSTPATFYSVSNQQEVSGSYVAPPTQSLNITSYPVTVAIGAQIKVPVTALNFSKPTSVVGTGVEITVSSIGEININVFQSGIAANVVVQSSINVDFGRTYGGGTGFKPQKPFELFKEEGQSNKDSKFIGGLIRQNIEMGGIVCYVWKNIGTHDQRSADGKVGTQLDESLGEVDDEGTFHGIQDSILGENRDRKYAENAVRLKGTYAVSENELDYARFGMALMGDVIQVEFHKEEMEKKVGRRMRPGDVVEMVHLREVGEDGRAMNRYYEVDNIARSPSGFDFTYQYHVLAATMKPIRDSQEFIDLMERETENGNTLRDQISNRSMLEKITAKQQDAANEKAYTTNYDITPLYIDDEGLVIPHIWSDDGKPPNGKPVTQVSAFPSNPTEGDYVVRIDMYPNKLYRYQSGKWLLKEKDSKRDWQPYNWTRKLREFARDGSLEDDMRPWELKSIHDILTPTQGRSNPSPKNHNITHTNIFDWDRMIDAKVPEEIEAEAPQIERSATLVPTNAQTSIADFLNAEQGEFDHFLIYYVIKRTTNQEVGEILINDDGTNVSMDHEHTDIGDVGVTFHVIHENGFRKLKYTMTDGVDASFKYFVKSAW